MKNAEFYARLPLEQKVNKPKRVIKWKQVLAIGALFIFFAPFLPSRRHPGRNSFPTDWFDYLEKSGTAAVLVCIIFFAVFVYERTRYTSARYHYKLVGTFEVKDKIIKPKKRISLHPGTNHLASVDSELFHQLNTGDKVYVERRLTGELISIKKIL